MSQIVDDLRQVAIEIKTETQVGGNTAARVGGAFERVADALEGTQQIEDMDAAVAAVQQAAQENEQTIQDIVNNLAVVQTTGQSTSSVMSQKAVTDSLVIGENIDYMSQTQYFDFFIAGNSPYKWTAKSSTLKYACRILPISTNASYKITAANNNPTHYALLRNNTPQVNVVATDWNGGAPRTLRAGESVQINTGEYTYLYVRNNTDSTTSDFKYPKEIELIKSVNSTVQEMQGSLTEVVDNVGEWNEKKVILGSSIPSCGGGIQTNTGKWVSNSEYYAGLVDVENYRKEKIVLIGGNVTSNACYTFTTEGISIGNTPSYATGYGAPRTLVANKRVTLVVPSDAKYLYVYLQSPGVDYRPQAIEFPITIGKTLSNVLDVVEEMPTSVQIMKGLAPITFTICTWNIGHFSGGARPSSSITSNDYATKLAQFRDLIYNTINPRVIALNEYSAVFGTSADNVSHKAKDVLFNDFAIKFEGTQKNYSCNALYGNTYLSNIKIYYYDCLKNETITHTSAAKATDYYYILADLYMEGRLIKLVSTHFAFDNNRGGELQSLQIQELVNVLASYDRAIVIGDLNLNGDSGRFNVFINAGYTIGNSGSIITYPSGTAQALDNIIYKGVVISGIKAIISSLSDHYPLVATITV